MKLIRDSLAIIAPVIEADLVIFSRNILHLRHQLIDEDINYLFVVVFQTKIEKTRALVNESYESFCTVLHTDVFNVSHARNVGMEHIFASRFQGRVLFFDSTITFDESVWKVYKSNCTSSLPLWFARVSWRFSKKEGNRLFPIDRSARMNIVSAFYGSYIWSAFISTELLEGVRFDERFGLGVDAVWQGGEDTLFIIELFLKNGSEAIFFPGCDVYHPPRPVDYGKHLKYAYGTGAMFAELICRCVFLRHRLIFAGLWFLSFCNALARCCVLRKNSLLILKLRILGFVDYIRSYRCGKRARNEN